MTRIFVDSSVLIAASLSATGASREIVRQAIRGRVTLVISNLVLEETEKNLARKAPEALPAFRRFLETVPFEIVRPTRQEVLDAAQYTAIKDAPIVAAAQKARVDYLVSLDRRHLVGVVEVARGSGLRIVLPQNLLEDIRK
jgi:predicted nucleic acid-binding protein